jgi:hypothetical protein
VTERELSPLLHARWQQPRRHYEGDPIAREIRLYLKPRTLLCATHSLAVVDADTHNHRMSCKRIVLSLDQPFFPSQAITPGVSAAPDDECLKETLTCVIVQTQDGRLTSTFVEDFPATSLCCQTTV